MVDVTYRCKRIQLLTVDYANQNKVDVVKILDEGLPRLTGKFILDEKLIFILQANDGTVLKVVWNNIVINNLEKAFGSETKNWIGKLLNVNQKLQSSKGGKIAYLDFVPIDSIEGVSNG